MLSSQNNLVLTIEKASTEKYDASTRTPIKLIKFLLYFEVLNTGDLTWHVRFSSSEIVVTGLIIFDLGILWSSFWCTHFLTPIIGTPISIIKRQMIPKIQSFLQTCKIGIWYWAIIIEHSHITSDVFGSFLTNLPTLIRYRQMWLDLPTYPKIWRQILKNSRTMKKM